VLRQQFAPKATDEELSYFAQVSRHLNLDPWSGHICLIPFGGLHRPVLTVAGRRWIAQRTGRLRGIVGPEWCGPRRLDRDGRKLPLDWMEVWDDEDSPPYASRCLVYVADWDHPANGTVKWSESAQYSGKGELASMWARYPSHMLGKCAESLALRRGFSEVQAAVAYLGGDDNDATLIREVAAEAFTAVTTQPQPAAVEAGPRAAVTSQPRPRPRRDDPDQIPDYVYDELPEGRAGWGARDYHPTRRQGA
jgi:hypothetical protein